MYVIIILFVAFFVNTKYFKYFKYFMNKPLQGFSHSLAGVKLKEY